MLTVDTSSVMQEAENGNTTNARRNRDQEATSEHASRHEQDKVTGMFADVAALFALIGASVRDVALLLGLETRLVIKTIMLMLVLSVILGLVLVGLWLSITIIVAVGLYEYTRLGLTFSIVVASLVNVVCAGVLFSVLRRLLRRLAFPHTRLAVRVFLGNTPSTAPQRTTPQTE